MKFANSILAAVAVFLVVAQAHAEYRTVLVQIKQDKDKNISVTIYSDEKKEQKTDVSVDDAAKVIGAMEGWGSQVGVYVVSAQGTPRAHLKKLLVALSGNPWLELEYFGREAPKVVADHFLKASAGPKPKPWAGEPVASVKWVNGGKLSTFNRLPKADAVTALRCTGEFNQTQLRLTAATFPGVLNSMRPVKADDPKYREWSFADWCAADFETSEGRFQVNFYLGGLALLHAPDGSVGLVIFEYPK
jgi:hypothetical protein